MPRNFGFNLINLIMKQLIRILLLVTIIVSMPSSLEATTSISNIIARLIEIESAGNDYAIGDNGLAVGCLQIHPIMVRDVNRIANTNFTLVDRTSRSKSIQMIRIYIDHYCVGDTEEHIVRKWNGGPTGHLKNSTLKYWRKYNGQGR
jgi:hypothetical protein